MYISIYIYQINIMNILYICNINTAYYRALWSGKSPPKCAMLLDGGTSPFPASVSRRSFGTFSHEALTSIGVISRKFLFIGVD